MSVEDRKMKVLQAIVDDYVTTNEPVGSKSLIERHNFPVSSATLRNDMAELEKMGLIEKPHTSAGRIPSDRGYREYVDSLIVCINYITVLFENEFCFVGTGFSIL